MVLVNADTTLIVVDAMLTVHTTTKPLPLWLRVRRWWEGRRD